MEELAKRKLNECLRLFRRAREVGGWEESASKSSHGKIIYMYTNMLDFLISAPEFFNPPTPKLDRFLKDFHITACVENVFWIVIH